MAGCNNRNVCNYLTGSLAVALSLYFLLEGRSDLTILAASTFFLVICVTDTLHCRIPNLGTLAITLTGISYHAYLAGTSGLAFSLLGLIVGFFILLIPYLMGGVGAGDVKALAGLGALLGPIAITQVFIYTALFGGLLAIMHYLSNNNLKEQCLRWIDALRALIYTRDLTTLKPSQKSSSLQFPYAAAIAFGFYAYVSFGGLI